MLANIAPPYGKRISVSLRPPGYQSTWPGAGWLVAFSGEAVSPMSRSPSGIQAASPLQRAWMICEWKGSSRSKAATVRGARSDSSAPLNANGPASTRRCMASVCRDEQPAAPRLLAAEQRAHHAAAHGASHPRRERVPVAQLVRRRPAAGGQVPQHEVGVRPGLDAALAADAEALRGRAGERPRAVLRRQLREHQRRRGLAAGDAAPGRAEVALLEVRRGRR